MKLDNPKMKFLLFPLLLLIPALQAGADTWSLQTSGTTGNLYSVIFPSGDTGYASGAGGVILRTYNGGSTWTSLTSGTAQPLYGMVSQGDKNVDTLYAVGGGGTILKSVNRGASWTTQASGTAQALRFVIANGASAFAGGDSGVLVGTTNGGVNWGRIVSGTTGNLYSIGVTGGDQGSVINLIAVGGGGAIRSLDTAKTWSALTLPSASILYGIQLQGNTAFAVGASGTLLKTANNGSSWSVISSGVTATLNAVILHEDSNVFSNPGYIVGGGGLILKTNNAGSTWTTEASGTSQTLNAITFPHNQQGSNSFAYAVGNGGVILKDLNAVSVRMNAASSGERARITRMGGVGYELFSKSPTAGTWLFDARGRLTFRRTGFSQ